MSYVVLGPALTYPAGVTARAVAARRRPTADDDDPRRACLATKPKKLEHLQALSVKAVQLAAQRAASMEDEKDDASEQPPPHRPLMRKGAAVGFVVAPRVDAVLAQCDESALPPPPGRKPRTPAKRSKAEPRARVRGVEGDPRARAARRARRGPAPPHRIRRRPVADGRLVWSAAAWKPHPEGRGGGGPCGDLVLACRNARRPRPDLISANRPKPPR